MLHLISMMFSLAFCVPITNHFSRSVDNNNSNDCDSYIAPVSLTIQTKRLNIDRQKFHWSMEPPTIYGGRGFQTNVF